MRLEDCVTAMRSKNAGPCQLTLDLVFKTRSAFEVAAEALPKLCGIIAGRAGLQPSQVQGYAYEPALAIKFTLPRQQISGSPGDNDVYGAQQHGLLMGIEL